MHHKRNIHAALLRLRDEGPKSPTSGICGNLEEFLDELFEQDDPYGNSVELVRNLMLYTAREWPKHSGCNTYPVPHPDADPLYQTSREVMDLAKSAYNKRECYMWDRSHPYGALRGELLDFLIERTK